MWPMAAWVLGIVFQIYIPKFFEIESHRTDHNDPLNYFTVSSDEVTCEGKRQLDKKVV